MRKLNGKQMMIQYISNRFDYSWIDKKIENFFEHQFIKIKSNFIGNSRPYQIYFHQHWQNPRTISAFWIIDEIPKGTRKAFTSFIHKLQHHNWLSSRSLNSSSFQAFDPIYSPPSLSLTRWNYEKSIDVLCFETRRNRKNFLEAAGPARAQRFINRSTWNAGA